jgi:hypothetical protein
MTYLPDGRITGNWEERAWAVTGAGRKNAYPVLDQNIQRTNTIRRHVFVASLLARWSEGRLYWSCLQVEELPHFPRRSSSTTPVRRSVRHGWPAPGIGRDRPQFTLAAAVRPGRLRSTARLPTMVKARTGGRDPRDDLGLFIAN